MRTLNADLLSEQKRPSRQPLVKVEVQGYGHPEKAAAVQWDVFHWERLHQDSTAPGYHSACIAGDGSLNRIRSIPWGAGGCQIMHQSVASPGPGSDFTQWAQRAAFSPSAVTPCAIQTVS